MGSLPIDEDGRRYLRQVMLPEIGEAGQKRLAGAGALVVGLGGLGSISAYYLAAAGVGRLRIVDRDRVALENLNRQLLHGTDDVGRPKAESAAEKLCRLNPRCRVEAEIAEAGEGNAGELAQGCGVIVDATDNVAARRALNRASLARRIPFVFGGVRGWGGMAATFVPGETGCFACLFPGDARPEEGAVPVVGPAAGVVASLQSLEALRILLGLAPRLAGRLLELRGAEMRFHETAFGRDPECPACGPASGGPA